MIDNRLMMTFKSTLFDTFYFMFDKNNALPPKAARRVTCGLQKQTVLFPVVYTAVLQDRYRRIVSRAFMHRGKHDKANFQTLVEPFKTRSETRKMVARSDQSKPI